MTTTTMNSRIPTPDSVMSRCRLEFQRNSWRVAIGVDRVLTELYRAQFHGPHPNVAESGRSITVAYPRFSVAGWLHPKSQSAELTLAAWAPWEIHFRRGVSRLRAELADSELCSLQIDGGASDVHLNLPAPRGVVPIRVGGGADKLTVTRPAGSVVCLHVGRGAHNLQLDQQRFGAVGGELLLDTPRAADASDRYEIEIDGGANHLTIHATR
jgi:hypothetical protein